MGSLSIDNYDHGWHQGQAGLGQVGEKLWRKSAEKESDD